jgi:hypothetical protein
MPISRPKGGGSRIKYIRDASTIRSCSYQERQRPHPPMRIEKLWPNTNWRLVWRNVQETPGTEGLRAKWYQVIHDLIPTNVRLYRINLTQTDSCRYCKSRRRNTQETYVLKYRNQVHPARSVTLLLAFGCCPLHISAVTPTILRFSWFTSAHSHKFWDSTQIRSRELPSKPFPVNLLQ